MILLIITSTVGVSDAVLVNFMYKPNSSVVLITEKLCEQGIEVSTFAFSIEVTYNEEEKDDEMES